MLSGSTPSLWLRALKFTVSRRVAAFYIAACSLSGGDPASCADPGTPPTRRYSRVASDNLTTSASRDPYAVSYEVYPESTPSVGSRSDAVHVCPEDQSINHMSRYETALRGS